MLVDYSKSLIITFNEYANVLPQKVVDKEVAKEIKEQKKEKEDKRAKHVVDSFTLVKKTTQ